MKVQRTRGALRNSCLGRLLVRELPVLGTHRVFHERFVRELRALYEKQAHGDGERQHAGRQTGAEEDRTHGGFK